MSDLPTHFELRKRLCDSLSKSLPGGCPAVLLGAPTSRNSGDVALALGELCALQAIGVGVTYISPVVRFDRNLIERNPDTIILLQGGGNLGTLWPENQSFRERVLAEFPDRKIVQLPQSVWFDDTDAIVSARNAFNGHPDFTVMLRDQASYDYMSSEFDCRVELVPDSAFGLPNSSPRPRGTGIRWLRREDHERRVLRKGPDDFNVPAFDWPDLDGKEERIRRFFLGLTGRLDGHGEIAALASPLLRKSYSAFAQRRVDRAYAEFDDVSVLITERLHGLILAFQAGVPVVALDNLSGKLGSFISTWLRNSPSVHLAHDGEEAISIAKELAVATDG
jgi:exopolysaccharide biosynthesis predicted pyruvyltransferase EpsI